MSSQSSANEPHRSIRAAVRSGLAAGVDAGLAEGLGEGLRRYLPLGVAILVIGIPACGLFAFVHFALGATLSTAGIATLGGVGLGGASALLRTIWPGPGRARGGGALAERDTPDDG